MFYRQNKMVVLITFLYIILMLDGIKAIHNVTKKESSATCSDLHEQYNQISKTKTCLPMSVATLNSTCFEEYHETCSSLFPKVLPEYFFWSENNKGYQYAINLKDESQMKTSCWGAYLRYTTENGETKCKYGQFGGKNHIEFEFYFHYDIEYTVEVALLPTGEVLNKHKFTPNYCKLGVNDYLKKVIDATHSNNYCFKNDTKNRNKAKFISELCEKYDDDRVAIEKMLGKMNIQTSLSCNISLLLRENIGKDQLPVLLIVIITSSVLLLLTFSCVFMIAYFKKKTRYRLSFSSTDHSDTCVTLVENSHDTTPKSVMILNRPGCELLETFLRDLAFILNSYGVNVKMALLEQNQLDAEGGIASYMQKNINECQYILIVCTENTPEDNEILKHRPYEFAVKIIGGLAFHQNDCSRYIPIYLTPYKEAATIIPSFLNASTTFGYQLPQETKKLLSKITSSNGLLKKDRNVKDQFFINRMSDMRKKIVEKQHFQCLKERCTMGMRNASVVNLSSIWASTMHSKWPSTQSMRDILMDGTINEIDSDSYETNLNYKYNIMINGKSSSCHDLTNNTFVEFYENGN